jgi:hypothetical protein
MIRQTARFLLCRVLPCVLLSMPMGARAEQTWIDGPVERRTLWCDLFRGASGKEPPALSQLQYLGEPDGSRPRVGEPYLVRWLMDVPVCSPESLPASNNQAVNLRVHVPLDTEWAITPENPITCWQKAPGQDAVRLPAHECATTTPRRTGLNTPLTSWPGSTYIIEPPSRQMRPLKAGVIHMIVMPFVTRRPLQKQDAAFVVTTDRSADPITSQVPWANVQVAIAPGGAAPAGGEPGTEPPTTTAACAVGSRVAAPPAAPFLLALYLLYRRRRR